jgi:Zinc knuckle
MNDTSRDLGKNAKFIEHNEVYFEKQANRLRYVTCSLCKEKGHFASQCPQKPIDRSRFTIEL